MATGYSTAAMNEPHRCDVVAIAFGPEQAASVRYRLLQFLPFLEREGMEVRVVFPAELDRQRRAGAALVPAGARVCWIQKKLLPRGVVRGLARSHRLVFDFDDAIWTSEKGPRSFVARWRTRARLHYTLRRSAVVIAGNDYLADYARRHAALVRVVPTVLDTDRYRTRVHAARDVVTLGWIGHSVNFRYLRELAPALRRLAASRPIRLLVVADQAIALDGLEVENRAWSETRETADLLDMDIGLMPLADDEWTRGKCAFKAIQYMAAGVPPVASDVGANRQLVDSGRDGFLATTEQQWCEALERLAGDVDLRARLGRNARAKVEAGYSLQRTGPVVAQLFADLLREAA